MFSYINITHNGIAGAFVELRAVKIFVQEDVGVYFGNLVFVYTTCDAGDLYTIIDFNFH